MFNSSAGTSSDKAFAQKVADDVPSVHYMTIQFLSEPPSFWRMETVGNADLGSSRVALQVNNDEEMEGVWLSIQDA